MSANRDQPRMVSTNKPSLNYPPPIIIPTLFSVSTAKSFLKPLSNSLRGSGSSSNSPSSPINSLRSITPPLLLPGNSSSSSTAQLSPLSTIIPIPGSLPIESVINRTNHTSHQPFDSLTPNNLTPPRSIPSPTSTNDPHTEDWIDACSIQTESPQVTKLLSDQIITSDDPAVSDDQATYDDEDDDQLQEWQHELQPDPNDDNIRTPVKATSSASECASKLERANSAAARMDSLAKLNGLTHQNRHRSCPSHEHDDQQNDLPPFLIAKHLEETRKNTHHHHQNQPPPSTQLFPLPVSNQPLGFGLGLDGRGVPRLSALQRKAIEKMERSRIEENIKGSTSLTRSHTTTGNEGRRLNLSILHARSKLPPRSQTPNPVSSTERQEARSNLIRKLSSRSGTNRLQLARSNQPDRNVIVPPVNPMDHLPSNESINPATLAVETVITKLRPRSGSLNDISNDYPGYKDEDLSIGTHKAEEIDLSVHVEHQLFNKTHSIISYKPPTPVETVQQVSEGVEAKSEDVDHCVELSIDTSARPLHEEQSQRITSSIQNAITDGVLSPTSHSTLSWESVSDRQSSEAAARTRDQNQCPAISIDPSPLLPSPSFSLSPPPSPHPRKSLLYTTPNNRVLSSHLSISRFDIPSYYENRENFDDDDDDEYDAMLSHQDNQDLNLTFEIPHELPNQYPITPYQPAPTIQTVQEVAEVEEKDASYPTSYPRLSIESSEASLSLSTQRRQRRTWLRAVTTSPASSSHLSTSTLDSEFRSYLHSIEGDRESSFDRIGLLYSALENGSNDVASDPTDGTPPSDDSGFCQELVTAEESLSVIPTDIPSSSRSAHDSTSAPMATQVPIQEVEESTDVEHDAEPSPLQTGSDDGDDSADHPMSSPDARSSSVQTHAIEQKESTEDLAITNDDSSHGSWSVISHPHQSNAVPPLRWHKRRNTNQTTQSIKASSPDQPTPIGTTYEEQMNRVFEEMTRGSSSSSLSNGVSFLERPMTTSPTIPLEKGFSPPRAPHQPGQSKPIRPVNPPPIGLALRPVGFSSPTSSTSSPISKPITNGPSQFPPTTTNGSCHLPPVSATHMARYNDLKLAPFPALLTPVTSPPTSQQSPLGPSPVTLSSPSPTPIQMISNVSSPIGPSNNGLIDLPQKPIQPLPNPPMSKLHRTRGNSILTSMSSIFGGGMNRGRSIRGSNSTGIDVRSIGPPTLIESSKTML